jgi:hypothetical protein
VLIPLFAPPRLLPLTNRGIATPSGGKNWNPMTVLRVMQRLGLTD